MTSRAPWNPSFSACAPLLLVSTDRGTRLSLRLCFRLLCEGHNTQMQDLLREQSSATTGARVDLVSEISTLLAALEPEMDHENVEQVGGSTP